MSGAWLPLRPETIPAELRALPAVLWRAEPRRADKPAKVPYQIADPMVRASSTDPATWGRFDDAVEAYGALVDLVAHPVRGPVVGIGVVLTAELGVTCLDLDGVLQDGHLDSRAAAVVQRCGDSWSEVSPSGTGLHVFVRGQLPRALKGHQIEVYSRDRYIAVTGHQWPETTADLQPAQAYLDRLLALDTDAEPERRQWTGPSGPPPDDLAGALLARLQAWGIPVARLKRWSDGFLVELVACPWAEAHTTGRGGAAVMIHTSGAYDFTCLHAHCAGRSWRDLRTMMETAR